MTFSELTNGLALSELIEEMDPTGRMVHNVTKAGFALAEAAGIEPLKGFRIVVAECVRILGTQWRCISTGAAHAKACANE